MSDRRNPPRRARAARPPLVPEPFVAEWNQPRRPLATARLQEFPTDTRPVFTSGDIWLGLSEAGHAVSVRDDRHILITGGNRSEKGTTLVMNNIALWPGSVVALAPKSENAVVMARRRANGSIYCEGLGQPTVILDPTDSCKRKDDQLVDVKGDYNTFDLIDVEDDESIDTAARIADALVVIENSKAIARQSG